MRKLVTIRTVSGISPIPDADAIELAHVDGWQVVVRKGEFTPGQQAIYVEIDSMLPESDSRFAFLMPRGVREDLDGHRGHVLRTVKLRKQLSQGLLMPLAEFPEVVGASADTDLAALLGIIKWEPPLPAGRNDTIGMFPSRIPKTDEERIQNIDQSEIDKMLETAHSIVVCEKIDGMSATAFLKDDHTLGVASRNWEISPESDIYKIVAASSAGVHLLALGSDNSFIQGEVYGEAVQANPLGVRGRHFAPFTYADRHAPESPKLWPNIVYNISVPYLGDRSWLGDDLTVSALIQRVDGLRTIVPGAKKDKQAEGVVVRGYDEQGLQMWSFKIINNAYLLKQRD